MIRWAILLLCTWVGMICYPGDLRGDADGAYQEKLRSINARIQEAYLNDDFAAEALGHYDRAMHNFSVHLRDQDVIFDLVESAKLYRYIRDDDGFYKARMALAGFYIEEDIFLDEALKLTAEGYQYYNEQGDEHRKAMAVTQLGRAYQRKLDYEKALIYVEEGLNASIQLEDRSMELANRLLLTRVLGNLGSVEKAIVQGDYIIQSERDSEVYQYSAEASYLMGQTLHMDARPDEAIPYLTESVLLNDRINDLAYESHYLLSKIYHEIGKSDLAFRHLSQANDITNELYNQEKYAMANQIAVKYKTMEKEQVIRELEEKNELSAFKLTQRTRFFIILCFFLAMGAFAAFNYYRLQKHRYDSEKLLNTQKEEIAKQKINDLENSLRIKNLQAVVRGQEAERTRIATDLHDSLGGMLSTLKLQYDSLQVDHEALIDDKDYHKIMGLIDDACRDVRDIARNLKPNALEKLGLTAALRDLVNRYRIKDTLDIHVNTNQVDGLLDEESSLHVYRIIQELLNNALKHAQATDIDVQIINVADELVIMVQDNGKGFDQSSIQKGLGLDNLASRVNVLQGEMEIDSSLARGTSVTVHIPLAKSEAIQNAELVTA